MNNHTAFKLARGEREECPTLLEGEIAYFKDTKEVVVGHGDGEYTIIGVSDETPILVIKDGRWCLDYEYVKEV